MQNHNEIKKMVDTIGEKLSYLKSRWNDERGYENFNDYKKFISEVCSTVKAELISFNKKFELSFKFQQYTVNMKAVRNSVKSEIYF